MRKPAPQLSISPKLLKQFAIATVIITGMVALFANGEAAQLQAEVQAREARNQLLTTEAEKFGTRRVAMSMKNKAKPSGWSGGDGDSGGSGEGSIDPDGTARIPSFAQSASASQNRPVLPRNMPTTAGQSVRINGQLATELPGAIGDAARAKQKGKAGLMFRPNEAQIETIKANARERSGDSGTLE